MDDAKVWDMSVEERDKSFKCAINPNELSSSVYKNLLTVTGNLPDVVEVQGTYRIAFKGKYSEPYVHISSCTAFGLLGRRVYLDGTEPLIALISRSIFDILDTDGGLPSEKSYQS